MNILAVKNHDSGNMETGIPERKPSLIGLFIIDKKLSKCQAQIRFTGVSQLYICAISYTLHNLPIDFLITGQYGLADRNIHKALQYSLNQETYLRVFLDNGDVPMIFRNYSRTHTYAYRLGITVKFDINIILDASTCYVLIFKSFFINLSTFSFFNAIKTIK